MPARMKGVMVVCCHDEWQDYAAESLLLRLLARLRSVSCMDAHVLCTNVDSLASVAEQAGFAHVPLGLPAVRQGHALPPDFRKRLGPELNRLVGSVGNIQLTVDAAHLLVRTETVEAMFDLLMEEGGCHEVVLGNTIDPHLYLKLGDELHQVYDHARVDRQKMPGLYRLAGVAMRHGLRRQLGPKAMRIHCAPWGEAMRYEPRYHGFFEEQSAALEAGA